MRSRAIVFLGLAVALGTSRSVALQSPVAPSAEAIQRLEAKREEAVKVARERLRLVDAQIAASEKGDKARAAALVAEIKAVDWRYDSSRALNELLLEVREAYRIAPEPSRGYIDGELREWRIEFSHVFSRAMGDGVAAHTWSGRGETTFSLRAFGSIPSVASYLVHEAVHFEQLVTSDPRRKQGKNVDEIEAYATQDRFAKHVGLSDDDAAQLRVHVETLLRAHVTALDKDLLATPSVPLPKAVSRFGRELAALGEPWSARFLSDSGTTKLDYWEPRLRGERRWVHLAETVSGLCGYHGPAAKKGSPLTVLPDYSWDRSFAAYRIGFDIGRIGACEQYVLEDFALAQGSVRHADLDRWAKHYWVQQGSRHAP